MKTEAIVFEAPETLSLRTLDLAPMGEPDVVVDIAWSGISTGTEKLLWTGRMPAFPGMGYPLVPGYESVGTIAEAGATSGFAAGDRVFVPGANCYGPVRGLFGGSAARVVTQGSRLVRVSETLGESAILLALAATARHTMSGPRDSVPDLVVGHGTLGRLLARLAVAAGGTPVVWERNPDRAAGAEGYEVLDPASDTRRDYRAIYDVSGDGGILDSLVQRLAPGGEIVLAGFYDTLTFSFPPAFMREARIRCAAQWKFEDLVFVRDLAEQGALSLAGLLTHTAPASQADDAYRTAFADPACLKMSLDWSACR
jgi:3-hydroxyethyl bacteriochlorophyllide a dehydrogenase